jgi:hypothetical protein
LKEPTNRKNKKKIKINGDDNQNDTKQNFPQPSSKIIIIKIIKIKERIMVISIFFSSFCAILKRFQL